MLRKFRVAGRFATRSDWQADLGDFEREVDQDVRTIACEDQGAAGAEGEARRPFGEQIEEERDYASEMIDDLEMQLGIRTEILNHLAQYLELTLSVPN